MQDGWREEIQAMFDEIRAKEKVNDRPAAYKLIEGDGRELFE